MFIPEALVWKMTDSGGCTAVKIYCPEELKEEVIADFSKVFDEEFEKVMDLIEDEEGSCYEKDEGVSGSSLCFASQTDYGVLFSFESFDMHVNEDHLSIHDGDEAFNKALKLLKGKYPAISYEGYVAYWRSDTHGGDVVQYAVSSEEKKGNGNTVYDFVGSEIAFLDDDVWDEYIEEVECAGEDELKNDIKFFHMYSNWIPEGLIDRIIETASEDNEEMRESLEAYLETLKKDENMAS